MKKEIRVFKRFSTGGLPRPPKDLSTVLDPCLCYEKYYYCFSNFSSFMVNMWMVNGKKTDWMTAEHAYQASKFFYDGRKGKIISPDNKKVWDEIKKARSAHDAKKIARANKHLIPKEHDNDTKVSFMEEVLRAKFAQHEFVRKILFEVGDRVIIEDSPKDGFWGWGPDKKGLNVLGVMWMNLRISREDELEKEFGNKEA